MYMCVRLLYLFCVPLSIIETEEIISMISNYFCQMLDMGRQQLPILQIEKRLKENIIEK